MNAESLMESFKQFLGGAPADRLRVTRLDGVAFSVEVLEGDAPDKDAGGDD